MRHAGVLLAAAAMALLATVGRAELLSSSSLSGPRPIRLSELDGFSGFRIWGENAGDLSGASVAAADINGDGFSDLIVGAPQADGSQVDSGATYVVFGKARGLSPNVHLSRLNGTNGFKFVGEAAGDFSGASVSAGDVNGDGFDDVITGAAEADPNGAASGATYVVFGASSEFPPLLAPSALDGANGFRINGEEADDRSGLSVSAAGDWNGDRADDVLISAPSGHHDDNNATYLLFGSNSPFPAQVQLTPFLRPAGWKLGSVESGGCDNVRVAAAGDVDGNGFDDAIIQHCSLRRFRIRSLLVPGTDETEWTARNLPFASVPFPIGDFNSDGFNDLLMARDKDATVLFGPAIDSGFNISARVANPISNANSAGDTNGDGLDEIILGASRIATVFVVFGSSAEDPPDLRLGDLDSAGYEIRGESLEDQTGSAVSSAGDVNGDGFADLLIGAPGADANGIDSGIAYVVYGAPSTTTRRIGTQADELLIGSPLDDYLSGRAGSDRITGRDGDDVLVGGDGDDQLRGGGGEDLLKGGAGRDILAGGPAADRFFFTETADILAGRHREIIVDFEQGVDTIDLRRIDARAERGDQAFQFRESRRFSGAGGELRYALGNGNTIVSGDIDGDRNPDLQIELIGEFALRDSDFRR